MINHWLYRLTAWLVSLAMLLQTIAPTGNAVAGQRKPLSAAESALSLAQAAEIPVPLPSAAGLAPEATDSQTTSLPDHPLTLAHAQSTAQAGGSLVVTYTLRSSLAPVIRPAALPGATITDTIAAIEATNFAADPNVIRDLVFTFQISQPQTSLQAASHPLAQEGSTYAVNLGDLSPLGTASLVLTLTLPTAVANFTNLDSGATAYGNWQGRPVNASTTPLRLAPDGLAPWLTCPVDANCADPYIVRQAAALNYDADAIFAFVRGLAYESYVGSLRGARGTLWSAAGNGYDQASLLIALLRASSIPAAYRLGTLSQSQAQLLIGDMFSPVTAVSGYLPTNATIADPLHDPELLTEAQDHAWVEAYLPGLGWTPLDPAFPTAQPGNVFGTPTTGQLAELPDGRRHKVTVALTLEKYTAFPIGGTNLYYLHPLTATFATAGLVGQPLVLAHLVESDEPGGMVFASAIHTYTPYFIAGSGATDGAGGEQLIEGEIFSELLSNFPFGQDFVTAEWLDFTVTDPNGQSDTYRRELFDDIGYAARAGGGLVGNMQRNSTARLSLMSSWTTLFAPSAVPVAALNDSYQEMVRLSLAGISVRQATAGIPDNPNPSPAEMELARQAVITYGQVARLGQRLHLLKFAAVSDQAHDYLADALLVRAYPDSPRIFTVGWERNDLTRSDQISFDLGRNELRALAYPGQTAVGWQGFNFWRALLDMALEHQVLQEIAPTPVTGVAAVLDQAIADGIPLERITAGTLAELAALPISEQAKARIATALTANPNQYVLVPGQMVTLPGAAVPTIGWLQIDSTSLEVIDVMENGQHMAAVEYAGLAKFGQKIGSFLGGFSAGFFAHTMGFWIGFFGQMPLGNQDINAVIAQSKATAAAWGKQAEKACNKKSDKKWCKAGVSAGNSLGAAVIGLADPPVQAALLNLPLDGPTRQAQTRTTLTAPASLSGQMVVATVTTSLVMGGAVGTTAVQWPTVGQHTIPFAHLTLDTADLYANGILLDSGPVTAVPTGPTPALAQTDGSPLAVTGLLTGSMSLHAPALPDLAAGSHAAAFALELAAAAAHTLSLHQATVTVNGQSYTGTLELVTTETAVLTGSGVGAVPNFASTASLGGSGDTGFMVAAASGSLSVGGTAVNPANGFALGGTNNTATITPAGTVDTFTFNGPADFMTLNLSSPGSTIPANSAANFMASVQANFSDAYTLTVTAPTGWDVTVTPTGQVTAVTPLGAAANNYEILVTAQSATYPDLFVSAVHEVMVTAVDGVSLSVAPEPLFTVPWGPTYPVINGDDSVGRLQLSGAAFAATVTNTSSISRTFALAVSGLPGGWPIFAGQAGQTGQEVALDAGQSVRVSLFISPTLAALPAAGTVYPFDVTAVASDAPGVTASDSDAFVVPALAYPALAAQPTDLFVETNGSVGFAFTLTNIGNTAGSFDLLAMVPVTSWQLSPLLTPVMLNPGQSATQPVTVTVTVTDSLGAIESGVDYPVSIGSSVPTLPYTPTTAVYLYVASPNITPIFQAATGCNLGEVRLSAALQALAQAAADLEESCASGSCRLADRDATVAALHSVTDYSRLVSTQVTAVADLEAVAVNLAGHTTPADIQADLVALGTGVGLMGAQLCALEQHRPAARFVPYVGAALLGETAVFTLTVTNLGTLTTTYAITTTAPDGSQLFSPTLNPGETAVLPISTTPTALGRFNLWAEVLPVLPLGRPSSAVTSSLLPPTIAQARLNVVDKFVQVTQLLADPAFVETGVSSTTLRLELVNVAGVAQNVTAETMILAPTGSAQWTADLPLTLLVGNPRFYDLTSVDTSGWAAGVYTVTVNLVNDQAQPIPNGTGYGYLGVGQALAVTQTVRPLLVAPGTVTVTTVITTQIIAPTLLPPAALPAVWEPRPLLSAVDVTAAFSGTLPAVRQSDAAPQPDISYLIGPQPLAAPVPFIGPEPLSAAPLSAAPLSAAPLADSPLLPAFSPSVGSTPLTTWAITRTEDTAVSVIYTGTWALLNNITAAYASQGNYHRSATTGNTASFSFSGTWVSLGFATTATSGYVEILVDGLSQRLVDLYRHNDDVVRVTLAGLVDGPHVVMVRVVGQRNPYSTGNWVNLDYFDVWDGTTMPTGIFEESNGRVWRSASWVNQTDPNASGGSYYRSGYTAWFPFTSDVVNDSVTFQAMTYSQAEMMAVYLDDAFYGYFDLHDFTVHTQTFTLEDLAVGPHVLTVRSFRGTATLDTFAVPGQGAAPALGGGFRRYEENDPALLYNGVPFTQTTTSWLSTANDVTSGHYVYYSGNANNMVWLSFTGTAVGVGFYAEVRGGYVEIFLDGLSQGVYDTYRAAPESIAYYFHDLITGTHTISLTVLGQANPFATTDNIYLDYIDVWDGTPLPDGTFEEVDGRIYRSYRWSLSSSPQASGGQYLQDAGSWATAWFPFSGDSFTFRTIANTQGGQWAKLLLDGQPLATINLYNLSTISRTFAFNGLGDGFHVLQLSRYRGDLLLDTVTTPGSPPFYQTPVYTGVVRYEEDDPALRYNGAAYPQRPQTWDENYSWPVSSAYAVLSAMAQDTVSLTFNGRWLNIGFLSGQYGGQAEIFVDGLSRGTIGLYSPTDDAVSFIVGDLITGTHTVTVTVLGLPDPPSPQNRVYLDYIDVWDGQPMADAVSNASLVARNGRVHFGALVQMGSDPNAINGDYAVNPAGNYPVNVWYSFTGDSFTFYGFSRSFGTNLVDVYVDGVFVETVDLSYPFSAQPLAYHYSGFGSGPHIVRIKNNVGLRVDAFASNQPALDYQPLAEWWESDRTGGASWWGGVHSALATGDVNGDGLVEIALTASALGPNGELFLLRGDGQDVGNGTPILWSVAYNIFNGFEHVGGVAIGDLDGQPGAEIVTVNTLGVYAYHSDGTLYWSTNALVSHRFFGTPAIGNLDLDDEPEIVINLNQTLAVFEHDGTLAWSTTDSDGLAIPLLADLTGDGLLDILVHDTGDTLYLYDYNLGTPQLVWTAVFTNQLHGYGAPAVADLNLDGVPEVAMASENYLFALNSSDGSVQWSAVLDPGRSGGVTIADIDGDGAMELVTGSMYNGGMLYAFEADGTLKWTALAPDTSPLNTSAADLDGDGAAELLWNGVGQGFTIFDGRTGAILFNEPLAYSATGTDVPVPADVDGDGYTEIIVPTHGGLRVFGFDGVWGPSRPLWNQLNYHITNIADDLSIPFTEFNSWEIHNTYRAQTPLRNPLPIYNITLTHTVAITGVTVLSQTFNVSPTVTPPDYGWVYGQQWFQPVVTRTFALQLTAMQPGEVRRVAEGTAVTYQLPSGLNDLTLPPLYVTAARILALMPPTQTVYAGGTAVYTLTLSNPAVTADSYTLSVSGLPADWLSYPLTVPLAAQSQVEVAVWVTVPATQAPERSPLIVDVTNGAGGWDSALGDLTILDGLDMRLWPDSRTALPGQAVTYTVTISNYESVAQTYTLSSTGLAEVTLPVLMVVNGGEAVSFPVTVTAQTAGSKPFGVLATGAGDAEGSGASDRADAILLVPDTLAVQVGLWPETAVAGPGSSVVYLVTLTNTGTLSDTFTPTVTLPAGWSGQLLANGQPVSTVWLPPDLYNVAQFNLLVTPPITATPGNYDLTLSVQGGLGGTDAAGAVDTAVLQLLNRGVQVSLSPDSGVVDPAGTAVWQVEVTNTGAVADTFDLMAAGAASLSGLFATNPVTLAAGETETVAFTADVLSFLLPGDYPLAVAAVSQADSRIQAQAVGRFTIPGYEGVNVAWQTAVQTVTQPVEVAYLLLITNTGNVATTYRVGVLAPDLMVRRPWREMTIPAYSTAALVVTAWPPEPGVYVLTATAVSASGQTSGSAMATLVFPDTSPPDGLIIYLPVVLRP